MSDGIMMRPSPALGVGERTLEEQEALQPEGRRMGLVRDGMKRQRVTGKRAGGNRGMQASPGRMPTATSAKPCPPPLPAAQRPHGHRPPPPPQTHTHHDDKGSKHQQQARQEGLVLLLRRQRLGIACSRSVWLGRFSEPQGAGGVSATQGRRHANVRRARAETGLRRIKMQHN